MIKVNMAKICNEMLDVLVVHKVPMYALDGVLEYLKDLAHTNTPVQNVDLEETQEPQKEITIQLDGKKVAPIVIPRFVEEISRSVGEAVACSLKGPESELHKLTIKGNILTLDGFELKGVTEYGVKGSTDNMTELSLKMMIDDNSTVI